MRPPAPQAGAFAPTSGGRMPSVRLWTSPIKCNTREARETIHRGMTVVGRNLPYRVMSSSRTNMLAQARSTSSGLIW